MPAVRRISAAVAVIAAAGLALTGCQLLPNTGGGSTDSPDGLEQFYDQELTWTDAGGGVDTTEATVPLDWDAPDGDTIVVALARHHATGESKGSILLNPGGPGGSGYDAVYDYAQYYVSPTLLENFDIIGFDPRGVAHSTPIICYTDDADRDESLYGTYDAAYGTQEWVDELTAREKDYAAACEENTGPLLAHIDAANVARDLDVVRSALGDEKLNMLGFSYATYLGTMYAELFPENVGHFVLDGAVDPQVGDLQALATQMGGFDSALAAYLDDCVANDPTCPFNGSDGLTQVRDLLGTIDGAGLMSADGREFDSATAGTAIAYNLYSESSWPDLTVVFNDLFAGDAQSAFGSADGYNGRNPDGSYADTALDVYNAVICAEGDLGTDGVDTLGSLEVIREEAPTIGDYFAYDDTAILDVLCSQWPYPVADLPTTFDAEGAPPILVIGTSNDPATPYANSVSLAKQLSSGVLISYEGEGHTIYGQGVACVDDTVDAFFLDGTVPASDPNC